MSLETEIEQAIRRANLINYNLVNIKRRLNPLDQISFDKNFKLIQKLLYKLYHLKGEHE